MIGLGAKIDWQRDTRILRFTANGSGLIGWDVARHDPQDDSGCHALAVAARGKQARRDPGDLNCPGSDGGIVVGDDDGGGAGGSPGRNLKVDLGWGDEDHRGQALHP